MQGSQEALVLLATLPLLLVAGSVLTDLLFDYASANPFWLPPLPPPSSPMLVQPCSQPLCSTGAVCGLCEERPAGPSHAHQGCLRPVHHHAEEGRSGQTATWFQESHSTVTTWKVAVTGTPGRMAKSLSRKQFGLSALLPAALCIPMYQQINKSIDRT